MFYIIENGDIRESDLPHITADTVCVGYLTLDEFREASVRLGLDETVAESFEAECDRFRTGIEVYDSYSCGLIDVVKLEDVMAERDRFGFLIRKNQFLFVKIEDEDGSTVSAVRGALRSFKSNATMEKIIYGTFDKLLVNSNRSLEDWERRIMDIEQEIVAGEIDAAFNHTIFDMRNRLSIQKIYYDQLTDIGEALQGNENDIFPDDDLRYFKVFTDKAERLSRSTQALSESLIHLREALDASLNYSMNRTMKVFTVVSTIFLPLTLLAGWYGMNFQNMPELAWEFGYPAVFVLSVAVVIICIVYFKIKKIL